MYVDFVGFLGGDFDRTLRDFYKMHKNQVLEPPTLKFVISRRSNTKNFEFLDPNCLAIFL